MRKFTGVMQLLIHKKQLLSILNDHTLQGN